MPRGKNATKLKLSNILACFILGHRPHSVVKNINLLVCRRKYIINLLPRRPSKHPHLAHCRCLISSLSLDAGMIGSTLPQSNLVSAGSPHPEYLKFPKDGRKTIKDKFGNDMYCIFH